MPGLFALAYLSETSRNLRPEELDELLLDARAFNASQEVTGALFYDYGRFFQLLEGTEESIRITFGRISKAKSHRHIRILYQGPVMSRLFESWHMGFVHATSTAIQEISQSAWEDAIPYTRAEMGKPEGLSLLMYYWNKWAAETARHAP